MSQVLGVEGWLLRWPGWRTVDRSTRVSRLVAVAFALTIMQAHDLLRPTTYVSLVQSIATRYGAVSAPIYSLVHGRPMEVCDSYTTAKVASLAQVSERFATATRWSDSVAVLRAQDAGSRDLFSSPCGGSWVWQPGSGTGHLFAQFSRDAWAAWLYARFGVTEAIAALFVAAGAVLGAYSAARLLFAATGSNLLLTLSLGGVALIDRELAPVFVFEVLYAWYGLSTAWLISVFASGARRSWRSWLLLVLALSVNLLGYLIISHSAAFTTIGVLLTLTALVSWRRPSVAKLASLSAVVALVLLSLYDCSAFSKRQLAPVTTQNFASSGSFGEFALTTGFWTERPNSWSYPLGDFGVYATFMKEPLISQYATLTFEYQGFAVAGRQLLLDMLSGHPLEYLEGLWKRAVLLVLRLPAIIQPTYEQVPHFVDAVRVLAVVAGVIALGSLAPAPTWPIALPVTGVVLWNFFGISVLTHLVHTHRAYLLPGFLQLLLVSPLLAAVGVRQFGSLLRRRRSARPVAVPAAVAALVLASLATPYFMREVRRELTTFDVWYQPWVGMYTASASKEALLPDGVAQRIERLRALGERTPGSISMYGAWTMVRLRHGVWASPAMVGARLGMSDAEVSAAHRRSVQLSVEYFRRALIEAPRDEWIPAFATVLDPSSAVPLYAKALQRGTDGMFAAHFAHTLFSNVADGYWYGRLFEQLTHRHWAASASVRPGFAALPSVQTTNGGVAVEGELVMVRLGPGGTASVGPFRGHQTDRLKAFVYVDVRTGSVQAALQVQSGSETASGPVYTFLSSTPSDLRYRFFQWAGERRIDSAVVTLTAGPDGATLAVRDLYPLIENPQTAYR